MFLIESKSHKIFSVIAAALSALVAEQLFITPV